MKAICILGYELAACTLLQACTDWKYNLKHAHNLDHGVPKYVYIGIGQLQTMDNLSIYLVKIRTYLKIRNAIPHMLADRHVAWSVLVLYYFLKIYVVK